MNEMVELNPVRDYRRAVPSASFSAYGDIAVNIYPQYNEFELEFENGCLSVQFDASLDDHMDDRQAFRAFLAKLNTKLGEYLKENAPELLPEG